VFKLKYSLTKIKYQAKRLDEKQTTLAMRPCANSMLNIHGIHYNISRWFANLPLKNERINKT
jgi:hypothetical protein